MSFQRKVQKLCHFGPKTLFWLNWCYITSLHHLTLNHPITVEYFTPHKVLASVVSCHGAFPRLVLHSVKEFPEFATFYVYWSFLLVVGWEAEARNVQLTTSFASLASPLIHFLHWSERAWDGYTSGHVARSVYYSVFCQRGWFEGVWIFVRLRKCRIDFSVTFATFYFPWVTALMEISLLSMIGTFYK